MNRDDFVKLAGVASDKAEYLPVAFLLCNGYACAGYYHSAARIPGPQQERDHQVASHEALVSFHGRLCSRISNGLLVIFSRIPARVNGDGDRLQGRTNVSIPLLRSHFQ